MPKQKSDIYRFIIVGICKYSIDIVLDKHLGFVTNNTTFRLTDCNHRPMDYVPDTWEWLLTWPSLGFMTLVLGPDTLNLSMLSLFISNTFLLAVETSLCLLPSINLKPRVLFYFCVMLGTF